MGYFELDLRKMKSEPINFYRFEFFFFKLDDPEPIKNWLVRINESIVIQMCRILF